MFYDTVGALPELLWALNSLGRITDAEDGQLHEKEFTSLDQKKE